MVVVKGWFDLPVHREMAAPGPAVFPVVGGIPLLLVFGAVYGVYRPMRRTRCEMRRYFV